METSGDPLTGAASCLRRGGAAFEEHGSLVLRPAAQKELRKRVQRDGAYASYGTAGLSRNSILLHRCICALMSSCATSKPTVSTWPRQPQAMLVPRHELAATFEQMCLQAAVF